MCKQVTAINHYRVFAGLTRTASRRIPNPLSLLAITAGGEQRGRERGRPESARQRMGRKNFRQRRFGSCRWGLSHCYHPQ